jgi:hypothetical protein
MTNERLTEHIDFVEDVAKLVRHVTWTESAQVKAKHAQINLHIFGPQVAVAATTLCQEPHSPMAKDNFETFCNMWQLLLMDVIHISTQVAEQTNQLHSAAILQQSLPPRIIKEPPTPNHTPPYSPIHGVVNNAIGGGGNVGGSSSRLGVAGGQQVNTSDGMMGKFHNKSVPNLSSSMVNVNNPNNMVGTLPPPQQQQQQALTPQAGSTISRSRTSNYLDPGNIIHEPRRHSTSGVPGYNHSGMNNPQQQHQLQQQHGGPTNYYNQRPEDILNSYKDVEKNEMVKKGKKMAIQADDMFDFTRGQGKVKTTQDLFTLAEYFAEECNLLYKVIRLFSYDVPTGEDKRSLMAIADNVPKHCHQLQMLIQSNCVGKAATFTKVDSIIKETRQIINLIVKVVEICYVNSKKYNLDFSNVSLEGRGNSNDDPSAFGSSATSSASDNS